MAVGKVNLEKQVFTTFEVARLCNANITSIKNWIEDGKIRAFRTPGGHYRIQKEVLNDFLNRYGMPNPFEKRTSKRVLVICDDPATVELVRRNLGRQHEVQGTEDGIEAGLLVGEWRPDAVVIDLLMPQVDGRHFVKRVREMPAFNNMQLIAYCDTEDVDLEHEALSTFKMNYFVRKAEGINALHEKIRQSLI